MARVAFDRIGNVSVSIGVAVHARGENLDSVLARADAALYAAKEAGRNRVVAAEAARGADSDGAGRRATDP